MIDGTYIYKRLARALYASFVVAAIGCGSNGAIAPPGGGGGGGDDMPPPDQTGPFATRVSRSSTIAISEDNAHIAMVNPDDGSLSVFATADNSRTAKVPTG